jgi:hypothetical protein
VPFCALCEFLAAPSPRQPFPGERGRRTISWTVYVEGTCRPPASAALRPLRLLPRGRVSVRLKWFGEDCLQASERIRDEPRYGLELIEHLSTTVQQLDKIAGAAQAKEEAMRQAASWRVAADDLLPNEDLMKAFRKDTGEQADRSR